MAELQKLGEEFELILVVNGGRDGTLDAARRAAAEHPGQVRAVTSKSGWGNAVIRGLENAHGDILCYTNSARTKSEDLVMALRYGAVNDKAVVKASRKARDVLLRRAGSVLYNFEARMLFGLAIWDVNGTPKVFHRQLLSKLGLTEKGDLIDLELAINCKQNGIPVVEIPVYDTKRHSGKATTNLRSALRMYIKPLLMKRQMKRRLQISTADQVA